MIWSEALSAAPVLAGAKVVVVQPNESSFEARLAARELRRYLYLRTGSYAEIAASLPTQSDTTVLLLLRQNDPLLKNIPGNLATNVPPLATEQFWLHTVPSGPRMICIIGGDDRGLLYGAYRYCELLGVRFYLHGDVIPDEPLKGNLPGANETGKPLFSIRGIQPFHDFPEGPDWWTRDDYLAYIGQLSKLRMNFLGMHCYPEGHPHAEPLVWIGLPQDQDAQGRVRFSYPTLWANTLRPGAWGYKAMLTSEFTGGADQLFAADAYGHPVQQGLMPAPEGVEQCNELFNRTGALLHDAFTLAKRLGVKTCIGTETPLTIPQDLQEHLKKLGKDPKDLAVVRELYEGMFRRILKTHPLDYYWLWTPEFWTWETTHPELFTAAARDIQAADDALKSLGAPFTLATSGWVLGPAHDRTALDRLLPKTSPMSCINREVGHDLVEGGFATLQGRPKWAIPWMENDPNLCAPQLWAARMRYDAADARQLGCTGLLGIHWRTKILAPNVAALAAAAWDQSYVPLDWDVRVKSRGQGPLGGRNYQTDYPCEGTLESLLYQTMRENLDGYDLDMPNGIYTVTLKFNEAKCTQAGQRVFGIKLQGKTVLERLDIFERVGRHHALDLSFKWNTVTNGHLFLEFPRLKGEPCVSAVIIDGKTATGQPITRKVKCGYEVIAGYERDGFNDKPGTVERRRTMPIEEFYVDFARAHFGDAVAVPAGKIFTRIDGLNLPQSTHWNRGPGNLNPLKSAPEEYAFVAELSALRSKVQGAGNLERFDYWLNTFRYQQTAAMVGGVRAELDAAMAVLLKEKDPVKQKTLAETAMGLRIKLASAWEEMMSSLVAATDTPGELGTIANLEQHSRKALGFLSFYDRIFMEVLGPVLPPETLPGKTYHGPARIIVPTVRSSANAGERIQLSVMVVDRSPVKRVELHWRGMNRGNFATVLAQNTGRAVFSVELPSGNEDVEYYVTAVTASGKQLTWPATAPRLCQTVITLP
ncbi:MAG: malectin domain-containing carbohydrate-binding protein [Verrucomicrobiota bacterium]